MSGLATKTELTTVENKIPYMSNLAAKTALTNLSNTVPDINRNMIQKVNMIPKFQKFKVNM